ncbi:30S ribosomal protein S18 [Clostridia bacterium]|nr:30S ribosomal protein S18 [Clostridia bacterium]GHV10994.1 30S ribosomal protein S18 [Clostridia bacterium]
MDRDRGERGERGDRDSRGGAGGNSRFRKKKKVCAFCTEKLADIDYKDVARLRKFVSERSKILPRRITGNCAKHQRNLTIAIKRARHIALIPYITD